MDIYLTKKSNKDKLRIPLLPDRVSVKTGAMVLSFQVIKLGEVKIPRGNTLAVYSWNGVFPGRSISAASFINDWQEPDKIIEWLKKCQTDGEALTLMITGTTINDDVFIESFNYEHYGVDNVSYTISLTHRTELYVTTVPAPVVPTKTTTTTTTTDQNKKYGTVKTSGSNLNVRKKASTSSTIIGKLKNKSKVEILGKTGNWYIIPHNKGTNGKGYICATYVKLDGSGSSSKSSSGKKSTSSSSKKKSSSSSSTKTTTTKKTLTVKKPSSTLVSAAKSAVKKNVTKVTAYSKTRPYAVVK